MHAFRLRRNCALQTVFLNPLREGGTSLKRGAMKKGICTAWFFILFSHDFDLISDCYRCMLSCTAIAIAARCVVSAIAIAGQ